MMVSTNPPKTDSGEGHASASVPPLKVVTPPNVWRALRAVFFREFWPNLPVALCAVAVCGAIALLAGIQPYLDSQKVEPRFDPNILFDETLRFLIQVGCPLIGLVIGFYQARRDLAADVWGFMNHRPVHRGVLFGGRVLAGAALYGIGAGVPLAVLVMYAASPSGGMPFHRSLLLPVAADALTGLVYYLAALLATQREARALGSRAVPVVSAVGVSIVVALVPAFWQAVVVIAVAGAVLAVAAYGAAASNGYRLGASRAARWATGVILLAGLGPLFWGAGVGMEVKNVDWAESAGRDLPPEAPSTHVVRFTRHIFLPDGTLGTNTHTSPEKPPQSVADNEKSYSYERTWPVKEPVDVATVREAQRVGQKKVATFSPVEFPPVASYRQLTQWRSDVLFGSIAPSKHAGVPVKENWYYVSPPGVYLGYDALTHAYLGSLGEDGFAGPGHMARPFGDKNTGGTNLTTPRGQFGVDLDSRRVIPLHRFPADTEMLLGGGLGFFTQDQLILYPSNITEKELQLPLAHSPRSWQITVEWFTEAQRWGLQYRSNSRAQPALTMEIFDKSGTRLTRQDWDRDYTIEWSAGPEQVAGRRLTIVRRAMVLGGAIDTFGGPLANIAAVWLMKNSNSLPMTHILLDGPTEYGDLRPYYLWGAGLTAVATAALAWLLTWWYGARWKALWVVGAVVFGPVLAVVFVALHAWPRRVRCEGCGRRGLVTDRACAHCGAARAMPARNGTEIFV